MKSIVVQVRVSGELHERLMKVVGVGGVSEYVRGAIEKRVGGDELVDFKTVEMGGSVERGKQGGALGRVATGKGGLTPPPTTKEGYGYGKKCRGCGEPLRDMDAHFFCEKCEPRV
jgi:hypothetical protein